LSDELLPYYEKELSFIRRMGARFAKDNPLIAGRLGMGESGEAKDPHVERMIEAFAYLNARTRHKLEDEFPELTEALLGVLYPHYQSPIPSLAVVQFELDPKQTPTEGHTIPRHSPLETDSIGGEPCRFRTCYPVTLWPISVQAASLSKPPFVAPYTVHSASAEAVLRLELSCTDAKLTFAELELTTLRFFLMGELQHMYRLYELIFNNTVAIALANGPDDPEPVVLGADCLQQVGFEADEGLLPYSPRSFLGYRLLTEFFAFPKKFLFVDLTGLKRRLSRLGNRLEVFLYLNRPQSDLQKNVSAETFRLGCTPIVNLYHQRAEPIQVTQTDYEYRVVPDARWPLSHEVYSVDQVTGTAADGSSVEFMPFFSTKHGVGEDAGQAYWHQTRKPAQEKGHSDRGTEIHLSLVDLGFARLVPKEWTLAVETLCLNRDLPHQLPFGGDQPRLQQSDGGALVSRIVCLTPPTPTLRPTLREGLPWRLISHLSLNHLSLIDGDDKAEAIREILKLYDFKDDAETRKIIAGIMSVQSKRVVGRLRGVAQSGFCNGVEVTIRFDEARFTGGGLFLLASVLERFLALYCTLNSFTKLVAIKGRDEVLRRWQPRLGEKWVI
jgi:type VI secretion system protein ImpG